MSFSIRIARVPSNLQETPDLFFEGAIEIGGFRERFWASAGTWRNEQYVDQWRLALRRVCEGNPASALITSLTKDDDEEAATWWPIIVEGERAFIWQEHRHPLLSSEERFRADNWISALPVARPPINGDHAATQWSISIGELGDALSKEDFYLDSSGPEPPAG